MKKKMTPYILLVPQLILGVVFIIGLGTGIIQSLGVIPAFGLTEPTLKYYKEVLTRPDLLQSLKYSMYIAFMSAFLATVTGTFLCAVLVSAGKVRGIIMRIVHCSPCCCGTLYCKHSFAKWNPCENPCKCRTDYGSAAVSDADL